MPDCEWCGRPPNEMTVSKIPHYCGEVWLCTDCASPDPGEKAQAYAEWKAARPEPSECRSCGEIEVLGERCQCAACERKADFAEMDDHTISTVRGPKGKA